MSDGIKDMMGNTEYMVNLTQLHHWAATGVSDYPPRDPLVGQGRFFRRYKTFIHTVDHDADHFAHVFAVEGEWGRGKSRLGHELVAQINDCSRGWYVRNEQGVLENVRLFDETAQDKYLALYIRYSQVASDYQNSDNWFGYGLYKALLPLATTRFDKSIQSEIAKQALHRLQPLGFDPGKLAECLQLSANHTESTLYLDPVLVVTLVQDAYAYLNTFGVAYLLVVLDELETVAEAATFGLEDDDTKRLDGQAIRLIGKAIKEEDPRRKLPWLRYVALCSPLLGQQLREIQSTARRFELVELEHNAFADVSDYVAQLHTKRKLRFTYPTGLVEAAYAMSGANFGWFNVIMANVDAVLEQYSSAGKPITGVGAVFDAVLASSGRVTDHVLDAHAIEGIKTGDHGLLDSARQLLFGQLPLAWADSPPRSRELLQLENEDGEPVASLYRKVAWDSLECRRALEQAKFQRQRDEWLYPSVEQPLSLTSLLQNLRTFAINEVTGDKASTTLLIPLLQAEFKHLLTLLYDHPAVEFAADALWSHFLGNEPQLGEDDATHIGPSVAMLLRLDLRYRNQQHNSMIFRDPSHADAHEQGWKHYQQAINQNTALKFQVRLTGLFRLLDRNWHYHQAPYQGAAGLMVLLAPRAAGAGQKGGLLFCDALKLHPDNQAWFAWVNNLEELQQLHQLVTTKRAESGRIPVLAFTTNSALLDQYNRGVVDERLRDDVLLYFLNGSETDQLERIGLLRDHLPAFEISEALLTSKFKSRLNHLRDFVWQAIQQWRQRLNGRGLIAWPLRPAGKLNQQDRELLFKAWKLLAVEQPELGGLHGIERQHGLDAADIANLFRRLTVGDKVSASGYGRDEQAGLFLDLENPERAQASLPAFLAKIANPTSQEAWTLDKARQDWYWGYLWQGSGLSAKTVFEDWMWWCHELHLFQLDETHTRQASWNHLPRSAFDNAITEAMNWFDGKAVDGYRATVVQLERVFGYDRIPGLFAPLGAATEGTETVEAHDQLKAARRRFDTLKLAEEALVNAPLPTVVKQLPALLQARAEILERVSRVKPYPAGKIRLDNVQVLKLEDKQQPLYQRIEQARQFAVFVEKSAKLIKEHVQILQAEVNAECAGLVHFPQNLFTLSLQTISNILDGVLQQANDSDTSKTEGRGSSETLLHYLRSLQLDKANERLQLLATEAGVVLENGHRQGFADIAGHILGSFRQAKTSYGRLQATHEDLLARCERCLHLLEDLPNDYPQAGHPSQLMALKQKLLTVAEAFEDFPSNAEQERSRFHELARKGHFSAIRDIPGRLFNPSQQQFNSLGGELLKLEQVLEHYQQEKVQQVNERIPALLTPLFVACQQPAPKVVGMDEVRELSLHDMHVMLDIRTSQWQAQAEQLLAGTGLSVADWYGIAAAILAGEKPVMSATTQQALVERGILKIRVAFGVGA